MDFDSASHHDMGQPMAAPASALITQRPIRNGTLRDILDEEFSRSYRFEGVADLYHDLKGFLRRMVSREPEVESDPTTDSWRYPVDPE